MIRRSTRTKIHLLFVVLLSTMKTPCASKGNDVDNAYVAHLKAEERLETFRRGDLDRLIKELPNAVEGGGSLTPFNSFILGRAYLEKGQYKEAITYFQKSMKTQGYIFAIRLPIMYYWLGRAYIGNKEYDKAIEAFRLSLEVEDKIQGLPKDPRQFFIDFLGGFASLKSINERLDLWLPHIPPKDSAYFWLGNAYLYKNQFEEAEDAFKKAIELDPQAPHYHVMLGRTYALERKSEEATASINKALEIAPNDHFVYGVMGKIYKDMKQYDKAISAFRKAMDLAFGQETTRNNYLLNIVDIYMERGNYEEAIKTLRTLPSSEDTSAKLVMSYLAIGQFDDAVKELTSLIDALTSIGIGVRMTIMDEFPVVASLQESSPAQRTNIQVGDKIVKIDGKSTKGWDLNKVVDSLRGPEGTQVTLTIERKGVSKPFEKTLTREKMIERRTSFYFGLRSLVYSIKGQDEEALKDAQMAYNLDPEDSFARSAMAFADVKQGKYLEALARIGEAKKDFNKLIASIVYAKMEDLQRCAEVYATISRDFLTSKNAFREYFITLAQKALAPYVEEKERLATSYESEGKFKDALEAYASLIKIVDGGKFKEILGKVANILKKNPSLMELPEEARKHTIRAEVMAKEGKLEEAEKEYKKAIEIAPFAPQLYKALASNYAILKEYQKAIDALQIYLELYPDAPDAREAKDEIYRWETLIEMGGK